MTIIEGGGLEFQLCNVEIVVKRERSERPRPDDLSITPVGEEHPIKPTPRLVSPSQWDQKLACERKWGYQYVDGFRPPQTKSQIFGVEMHEELDTWLTTATPPKSPLLLSSGALEYFPPPKTEGLTTEQVFVFRARRPGGEWVYFWGFMDARIRARIWDLKTTSDLCWMKVTQAAAEQARANIDELRESKMLFDDDTQAITYAIAAMLIVQEWRAVLTWVYVQTRGAKNSKPVEMEMTWRRAAETFAKKFPAAEEIVALRKNNSLTSRLLQANPKACGAYGGCPHQHRCDDLTGVDSIVSLFAQDRLEHELKEKSEAMMSPILQKLEGVLSQKSSGGTPINNIGAAAGQPAVTTAAPVVATPPVVTPPPATGSLASADAILARINQTATVASPSASQTTAVTAATRSTDEVVEICGWPAQVSEVSGRWFCTVEGKKYEHVSRDEVITLASRLTTPKPPPPPPPAEEKPARKARDRKSVV